MATATETNLSIVETAALTGVEERRVRKDIEHRIFPARGRDKRLGLDVAVYLRVEAGLSVQLGVEDRRRLFQAVSDAVRQEKTPARIALGDVAEIRVGEVKKAFCDRQRRFQRWRERRVVVNDDVLAGEPVFKDTRLAVRKIGRMVSDGLGDEVREDYPYLTEEDLEFAPVYLRAYPKKGRPREAAPR